MNSRQFCFVLPKFLDILFIIAVGRVFWQECNSKTNILSLFIHGGMQHIAQVFL